MNKFTLALAIGIVSAPFYYYHLTEKQRAIEEPTSIESAQNAPQQVDQTDLDNYEAVMDLAWHGNYQAQRNIAYGFVAYPYHNQEKNRVLGCAWYLVVLNSGSTKVDSSDQSNVNVYCRQLEPDLLEAAKQNAGEFLAKIKENTKAGKVDG